MGGAERKVVQPEQGGGVDTSVRERGVVRHGVDEIENKCKNASLINEVKIDPNIYKLLC